jgi:hypothetical protein
VIKDAQRHRMFGVALEPNVVNHGVHRINKRMDGGYRNSDPRIMPLIFAPFPGFHKYLCSISRRTSSFPSAALSVFDIHGAEPCILGSSGEILMHHPFRRERTSPLDPEVALAVTCAAISRVSSRLKRSKALCHVPSGPYFWHSCQRRDFSAYHARNLVRRCMIHPISAQNQQ